MTICASMKQSMRVLAAVALILSGPALARDADFPSELKALNACYIAHKGSSRGTDAALKKCMAEEHGYRFVAARKFDGRSCRHGGIDHPDCWAPICSKHPGRCGGK
jgi:hypothetical protein